MAEAVGSQAAESIPGWLDPDPHLPATKFRLTASPGLPAWLAQHHCSLAFSTYRNGKLFLVGLKPDGSLGVFERTFNRCMGLWSDTQTLWLAGLYQLWRLENMLAPGRAIEGHDRVFVPRAGHTTGSVDAHDVAVTANGQPIFVATLFNCLARLHDRYNFEPIWRPPFIDAIAPEDRCHLNGVAVRDGEARYVTYCAQTNTKEGWRDARTDGGGAMDIASNEVLVDGLSMPHSPRWHRDRLWLLNSGRGSFGHVGTDRGGYEPLTICPGYARGLAFHDRYAVVGVSKPRHGEAFGGLPLDDILSEQQLAARCGLQIIDIDSGKILHWLRLDGVVEELYDVMVLPGVTRPKALGFQTDEIRSHVWLPPESYT